MIPKWDDVLKYKMDIMYIWLIYKGRVFLPTLINYVKSDFCLKACMEYKKWFVRNAPFIRFHIMEWYKTKGRRFCSLSCSLTAVFFLPSYIYFIY